MMIDSHQPRVDFMPVTLFERRSTVTVDTDSLTKENQHLLQETEVKSVETQRILHQAMRAELSASRQNPISPNTTAQRSHTQAPVSVLKAGIFQHRTSRPAAQPTPSQLNAEDNKGNVVTLRTKLGG